MAVKIVRQPNRLALLGVPSSAAALSLGRERAPSALRSAGLIERLESLGYKVTDLGDSIAKPFQQDAESPRARNLPALVSVLDDLKPRVEHAVKSGALPLILSGDSSAALATIAAVRRYFRGVGMIYLDSRAGLLTPATTRTGSLDGMVASHLTGRGAAELVRFWGEPPLVREPDLAIFGIENAEPSEDEVFRTSPLRPYLASDIRNKGAAAAAQAAIDHIHGASREFVLHLSVNVIAGFQATDDPAMGGLQLDEVREVLAVAATQKHLAAIEVTSYNPEKDSEGRGAQIILGLLADALAARLAALQSEAPADSSASAPQSPAPAAPAEPAVQEPVPAATPGEAWSSDSLEEETVSPQSPSSGAPEDSDS